MRVTHFFNIFVKHFLKRLILGKIEVFLSWFFVCSHSFSANVPPHFSNIFESDDDKDSSDEDYRVMRIGE